MASSQRLSAIASALIVLAATTVLATEPVASTHLRTELSPARPLITTLAEVARGEQRLADQGIVFGGKPSLHAVNPSRCVILVPGLLAREQSMVALLSFLESQQYVTGTLRYSSHQGIKSAAALLAGQLRSLKTSHPQCEVVLLTHSMGGLVARYCLEDPTTNPGNVTDLIMIAPPNHGSAVAGLSAAELATSFLPVHLEGAAGAQTLDDAVASFIGTPLDELKMDSPLLCELNARPRAAGTRYTILAGSGGPVSRSLVEASSVLSGLFLPADSEMKAALRSARKLASLDEWTEGRGDGVVSIKSASLDGVDEIIVLPFAHNDFGTRTSDATSEVIAEVHKRLDPMSPLPRLAR
ncbi:MAG: esterase/lipase family protein [Planctomycetaceae bacterium]